jgi:superfamily II DNA or RNA helicase
MSIKINIEEIPISMRTKMMNELDITIKPKKKFGFGNKNTPVKQVQPFLLRDGKIYLPFHYANQLSFSNDEKESNKKKDNNMDMDMDKEKEKEKNKVIIDRRPPMDELDKMTVPFTGELRPHQKVVKKEAIDILNKQSTVILSLYPGYGKTSMAIYIASKIGLKTCVIVHRIILVEQWKESITRFCPNARVQILAAKSKRDPTADFYIINAINVEKLDFQFFKGIGLLVVDEIHTIVSDILSRCFFHIQPRFLIGLSATPYRSDGMDILLDIFFGTAKILRTLNRQHTVYHVKTGFVPDVKMDMSGKMIWNSVLESQATSVERNQIIIDIVRKFPDRYFLILCKRVSQAHYLHEQLKELGEKPTLLVGSKNDFDKTSRVLISSVQKSGVGFSHDILNSLIIASDMEEYFVQYLGRVIRTEQGVPLVFDLVDEHSSLKRHFAARKKVYEEAGGKIIKYDFLN